MLLTIDIGNTHIAAGLFDQHQLTGHWRLSSEADRTEDETWILMDSIGQANGFRIKDVTGIAISSVVPDMTQTFIKLSQKYLKIDPLVINHETNMGLTIKYRPVSHVGADRLCNAIAGYHQFGGPLIIVDFGTATTFDIVSKDAEYLGGIIAPGIETSLVVLHQKAARLPKVSIAFPESSIGDTTEKSIQSGLLYGTVEMIDGMIQRISGELGVKAKTVATGGLARVIIEKVKMIEHIEPYLTLEGIRLIYEKNKD